MSLSWCRAICGISPSLSSQIEAKLREVTDVFPFTIFIVVLTRDGEIIAQSNSMAALANSSSHSTGANMKANAATLAAYKNSSALSLNKSIGFSSYHSLQTSQVSTTQDLTASIMSLMKTANELVNALSQPDCPVLHVRGHHHLFSCYAVDSNVSMKNQFDL
jgi:hypothetical protein